MDWIGSGIENELIAWLEAAASDRYVSECSLDPFATSMRDLDDVANDLIVVATQSESDRMRWGQRLTDLKSAGLLSDDRQTLSDLGQRTLSAWEKYGVATHKDQTNELARHLLLLIEATQLKNPVISPFYSYWLTLRNEFDGMSLIENWDSLFVINFLDYPRSKFSPGQYLRKVSISIPELELGLSKFAIDFGASEEAILGAEKIEQACAGRIPRGRHRATFCMALELLATNGEASKLILDRFGYPKKVGDWKQFNSSEKILIQKIIKEHLPIEGEHPDGVTSSVVPVDKPPNPAIDWHAIDFSDLSRPVPKPDKKASSVSGKSSISGKTDYVKKNEANKIVGDLGEEFALRYEAWRLRGNPELADKIKHVAATDDSLGYDIQSYNLDGSSRLVEVKATVGQLHSPFFITANELATSKQHSQEFVILRVAGLLSSPVYCEITGPIEEILDFEPSAFVCTFKST